MPRIKYDEHEMLSPIARSIRAGDATADREGRMSADAGRRALYAAMAIAKRAEGAVRFAERELFEADAAVIHRREDLNNYRRIAGLNASLGEVHDRQERLRIAEYVADERRQHLAACLGDHDARLAAVAAAEAECAAAEAAQ